MTDHDRREKGSYKRAVKPTSRRTTNHDRVKETMGKVGNITELKESIAQQTQTLEPLITDFHSRPPWEFAEQP